MTEAFMALSVSSAVIVWSAVMIAHLRRRFQETDEHIMAWKPGIYIPKDENIQDFWRFIGGYTNRDKEQASGREENAPAGSSNP